MKSLFLLSYLSLSLFAFSENITTFSADFKQEITDDNKNVITYSGHVWANKNNQALWEYLKPITKKVFINKSDVKVVEDDLEQVIIKKFNKDIDFFALMKKAKAVNKNSYEAEYFDTSYMIYLENDHIARISYEDSFANQVQIIFSKQKQNDPIDESIFSYEIPIDYDVLRE